MHLSLLTYLVIPQDIVINGSNLVTFFISFLSHGIFVKSEQSFCCLKELFCQSDTFFEEFTKVFTHEDDYIQETFPK